MQNLQKYKQWKEAVKERHKTASASAGFRWNAAKRLFVITSIVGVLASILETTHPSLMASSFSSAAKTLSPVVPNSQTFVNEHAASAVNLPTTMPLEAATSKLFTEFRQQVEAMDSNDMLQEPDHDDDNHRTWLCGPSQHQHAGSNVRSNTWALEDSQLRAAELECDLASMHEESQQLSAHLLQAARQLAAVGQPVKLPQAQQTEPAQTLFHSNTVVLGMLLLVLAWTLWALLTAPTQYPRTAQRQATKPINAEQVCLAKQVNQLTIVKAR